MNESGGTALRMRPVSLIGEGARGEVFVGVDEVLRRQVIIKKLSKRLFENEHRRSELIREAQILARLNHPNVLRVFDYGEDGDYDVFTIEYVPGTTLFEELGQAPDFARKLRIATLIAEALVVVHRAGVVHGALSPDSVLLTPNGGVKITDFATTTSRIDGPRAAAHWRSPEQARGQEPSRTTDMYAFGLILREMFGTEDRDVRAVIAALVHEVPSERATAAVALGRLQRIATRGVRRIRAAAIALVTLFVAGGGLKYTVDLRREQRIALAAKAEAEARREQAHALIDYMIVNIGEKLGFAGRLDLMDATSEKALAYFASMSPSEISPGEARTNLQALMQLAQTKMARGDYASAQGILQHAIGVGDAALRGAPDDSALRMSAASAHAFLTNTLDKLGDIDGALAEARLFAEKAADLARRHPENLEFVHAEASAHGILALLYDRKEQIEASLRELELDVAVKRRLLPLNDTPQMRFEISIPIHKLGLAQFKLGRFKAARMTLETERANLEALLAQEPSQWPTRELLALYDDDLVTVAFATGDLASAEHYAASQLERSLKLAAFDPANLTWKRRLVDAHRSTGTLARMRGDLAGAVLHHRIAVDLLLAANQPKVVARDLALSRIELGRTLLAQHQADAAKSQLDLAVAELQSLRAELPARRLLADALFEQGEVRNALGDAAGASASWDGAQKILEPLDRLSPDPRITDTHVRVLLRRNQLESARPLIDELAALGYGNPEFMAVSREKGVSPTREQGGFNGG